MHHPPPAPPIPDVQSALNDLREVVISEQRLQERIAELAAEISLEYAGRELVLVNVLKGGVIFLADLMRRLTVASRLELVGASSYKGDQAPHPDVRITKDVDQNLRGRHVLLVEDIYDTGSTMHVVHDLLKLHRPASLEICTLLRKRKERSFHVPIKYVGFEIEDAYVVGYGLDFKEQYRYLPCIGILKPELCA